MNYGKLFGIFYFLTLNYLKNSRAQSTFCIREGLKLVYKSAIPCFSLQQQLAINCTIAHGTQTVISYRKNFP